MSDRAALLAAYLDHVRARIAAGGGRAALPEPVAAFAHEQPHETLAMIIDALDEPVTPEHVRVVGDGLLEALLNEHSDALAAAVSAELRRSKRFRQAFSFGEYASVDPALLGDWIDVLASLGTSKKAERRGLWSKKRD
jgi:hypothetical protein